MSASASFLTIHLAADHAGFAHKEAIKNWLKDNEYAVVDHGAYQLEPLDDYTDFISLAAAAVKAAPLTARAVIFGGSGQGEAILANRYAGVRATVYYAPDLDIIRLSREHNDANVLSIGARFVGVEETQAAILLWLKTPPSADEKHRRRNQKIEVLTKKRQTL